MQNSPLIGECSRDHLIVHHKARTYSQLKRIAQLSFHDLNEVFAFPSLG